eukprot:Gregarina_sp_Pseudo_9__5439@NODE_67_length_4612_cov_111_667396_g62_i0_p1_GENE_NODE_67_length_4612_cov_111_667396_g62_i0NODE_67_length_4612_cov_111_667396_g62_i0_p1_ORF_typecomplete_len961_score181_54DUF3458_C/PF17432_2/1e03DUF3458_C/PF17432_2/2_2e69Peptidase_M1/PF01433_20/2_8e51DUF3458/PF11940_8/8_4e23Peptidase_M1_N/PF17900_1/1_7e19Peptidase_M1_N/PF17900_1/1_4e03Peptidase_M61/PF05299_12/0_021DUF2268/PF10026_9/0_032_NODE_67_length_4612_cov_111_667396_g62_i015544436
MYKWLVFTLIQTQALEGVLDFCVRTTPISPNRTVYLSDYEPYPWTIADQVKLDFALDRISTIVNTSIALAPAGSGDVLVLEGSSDIQLNRLAINGTLIFQQGVFTAVDEGWELCQDETTNQLQLTRTPSDNPILLETSVEVFPYNNTELFGLYESDDLLVTQNEAWGFRRITFYPDRPDVSAIFDVTITANRTLYPVILSNGNLVSSHNNSDGSHTVRFLDPFPKPSYLFALVAGQLEPVSRTVELNLPCIEAIEAFHQISREEAQQDPLAKYCSLNDAQREGNVREVEIHVWGRPGTRQRLVWAMESAYKAMLWDEIVYGRLYDLDIFHIVAVKDFNAGAMENKGLNIFNIALIEAVPEIATDQQYIRIRGVVAHEYFHNWSGDRVTLRDWFQLTLKEGFTVFRDEVFTEDITKSSVKRVQDAKFMIDVQFQQDASPLSHPIRPESYQSIENFYTVTVYEKGAEVVRMLHTLLGWRAFRRGTDFYFDRYDASGATCEDFVNAMERVTGRNLNQFKLWYSTPGTPVVTVTEQEYDEEAHRYSLTLKQTSNSTEPLLIPIKFTLWTQAGTPEQLMPEVVIELKTHEEEFVFEEINEKPVPSILRGFSAPVIVKPFLSDSDLLRLATHDNDGYVRWQSAQSIMERAIKQKMQISAKLPPPKGLMFFYENIFKQILNSEEPDLYLLSYILRLPTVQSFEDQVDVWMPERVHETIVTLKLEIGNYYYEDMMRIIQECDKRLDGELYNVRPMQVGVRALRNLLLEILSKQRDNESVRALLETQLTTSEVENDRAAALGIIADYPPSEWKESALKYYHDRNVNEPVLMDRLLATQAGSTATDTIDQVSALMKSPLYANSTNPNRLRALFNTFSGNPVWFHEPSGRGYELVANEVIRWDGFNAKLAARLATSFSRGKKLPSRRRRLIVKQLERVLLTEDLSLNTKEIATKILHGLQEPAGSDKRTEL